MSSVCVDVLADAASSYRNIVQLLRLCVGDVWDVENLPIEVQARLLRLFDLPDVKSAQTHLKRMAKSVRNIFLAAMK